MAGGAGGGASGGGGGGGGGGGHGGGGDGDHDGPAGAGGVFGARAWAEGAAVCRVSPSRAPGGAPLFGAATYALPQVSARMVPLLRAACERLLGAQAAAAGDAEAAAARGGGEEAATADAGGA